MRTDKFWVTAIATVATAGMIGVAIAQTGGPLSPGGTNTGSGTSGTGSSSPDRPIAAESNTAPSSGNMSPSSDASSNTVAQADRG